jgi:3-hydroxymyristoyl/3-hydroxydecanoyl-(acyl carrier protein) dehydratase
MIDRIDCFIGDGGPNSLGFIRGSKNVDPDEWFFQAHFYQDPVCPGSLGLEALLQLLKIVAVERWQGDRDWQFETVAVSQPHRWIYRGQILPANRQVDVEATITAVDDERRFLRANGLLSVDGRVIYQMSDFTLRVLMENP